MEEEGRTYLQLPENLRLAAGLEVLQSLGPEAVLLVQGAMATRGADESMTMQEPEHESGPAVWRPVLPTFFGLHAGESLGKSLRTTVRAYLLVES